MEQTIVGIDAGIETIVATVVDAKASVLVQAHQYANTFAGYEELMTDLAAFEASSLLFCVENTGVYCEALCYALHERGYRVAVADPLHVSRSVRDGGRKTDEYDSLKIAEYGARYADKLRLWNPNEVVLEQIRILLSTREQLVKQRTASKNMLTAWRRKMIQTAIANEALADTIDHLKSQIEQIEAEIRRLINDHPTLAHSVALLLSVPGVGLLLSAHMALLTKGFTELPSYTNLAAYLGISPRPYQSGTSVFRRPQSRQFGPAIARKLLHLAARTLATHNRSAKTYYLRKQAEGKPRRLILNNLANKQLRIICAVLRNDAPFNPNYRSINPRIFADIA